MGRTPNRCRTTATKKSPQWGRRKAALFFHYPAAFRRPRSRNSRSLCRREIWRVWGHDVHRWPVVTSACAHRRPASDEHRVPALPGCKSGDTKFIFGLGAVVNLKRRGGPKMNIMSPAPLLCFATISRPPMDTAQALRYPCGRIARAASALTPPPVSATSGHTQ